MVQYFLTYWAEEQIKDITISDVIKGEFCVHSLILYVYFVVDVNCVKVANYVEVICLYFAGPAPLLASAERVNRA